MRVLPFQETPTARHRYYLYVRQLFGQAYLKAASKNTASFQVRMRLCGKNSNPRFGDRKSSENEAVTGQVQRACILWIGFEEPLENMD
jgi:hypothetical protein